jgi:hypothetical protein
VDFPDGAFRFKRSAPLSNPDKPPNRAPQPISPLSLFNRNISPRGEIVEADLAHI